ncbi:MAG: ABC transporter substrate-binding protein [Candidatus Hydrogenedentes bacterium]|nr:ABC transporter substrate-binding protein [Candidatus Hydrogenedentota bacterium]
MKKLRMAVCTAIVLMAIGSAANAEEFSPKRIVSLDGGTTETLFALGAGGLVVARDEGSTYPPEAAKLPAISTGHQLNVEAILALKPDVVVGRNRSMSGPGMHILEQAHVRVVRLPDDPGIEVAQLRIKNLASLIGKEEDAKKIIESMQTDLDRLEEKKKAVSGEAAPRVLIVYLRPGVVMMMGEDSNAAAMTRLAGGRFAVPGMKGYKELNAEAAVAAQPDVILCYTEGLEATGGADALWNRPGLAETPAGRARCLIAMDDLLLAGFGPRTGDAALQLFDRLHGQGTTVAKAHP